MSKAPPIPDDQQGRLPDGPHVSGRHAEPEGAKARVGMNPDQQGQSANTRKNAPRWGKTQDR
jgi:hypothetical protein